MSVELITVSFACAECGQRDTATYKARDCASYTIPAHGHTCGRCRERHQRLHDRKVAAAPLSLER